MVRCDAVDVKGKQNAAFDAGVTLIDIKASLQNTATILTSGAFGSLGAAAGPAPVRTLQCSIAYISGRFIIRVR